MPKDHLPEVGPNLQKLPPDRLYTDGGTQPRGRLDDDVVERYAEAMVVGLWDFNKSSVPITAFSSERSKTYWLADGFHRVAAAKQAGLEWVEVDVRQGNQREAILYSVGTNATHGYPRSVEDKRRAVSRLLDDAEWSKWSDREIARRCSVAPTFVGKLRSSLSTVDSEATQRTYKTKHGTVASMKTHTIGGKSEISKPQKTSQPTAKAEWSLPEHASGGVHALAELRRLASPDASATQIVSDRGVSPTLTAEPVGELPVDPTPPRGRAAADAEREKDLFVAVIRPLLDGLIAEGKKNIATTSPGTVAHLAAKLEEVLVGWGFATYGERAKRCRLCGKQIKSGKIVTLVEGPAHWTCQQNDEGFQRWLKTRDE